LQVLWPLELTRCWDFTQESMCTHPIFWTTHYPWARPSDLDLGVAKVPSTPRFPTACSSPSKWPKI
jgi:hypothetical protein